jgi:type I restriction enzyme S subunit
MKIERYPAYKDSEIELLGEVPKHWEVKRIKEVGTIKYGLSQPPEYLEHGLPLIRATNIERGKLVDQGLVFISPDDVPYEKNPVLKENDILVVRSGAHTADSAIIPKKYHGSIAGFDMVLSPCNIFPKYLSFTLLSNYVLKDQLILSSFRAAQPHLNKEELGTALIVLPPLSEQKAIAHYLDTKTAQIDRKIDLLTQKATLYGNLKQSLISETVTRGLDKSVPMKDSAIEWLGEVPEHWDIRRIKEVAYINKRTLTEKTPNDYEFDYIDIGSITYGVKGFSSERMTFGTAPSRAKRIVKKGDTIVSTVRTYLKAITSIDDDFSDLIVSTGFAVISPKKMLFSKYFAYLSTSNFVVDKICTLSTGVSYPATNSSVIADLLCLIPPLSEQKAIADYLDTKTAQIDQIIQTINTQIEKLKELRKTLINDVVTGKIRVIDNGEWRMEN